MASNNPAVGDFVRRLTGCQPRIYAYITALVLDPHEADEILQQVNLVMWEKVDEFLVCENFDALACRVAHFQVLARRRDRSRERRRLLFDDQLIESLATAASDRTDALQGYLAALHDCMSRLPDGQRELVRRRYEPGGSVNTIAADRGDSPNTVSAALYRIRKVLLECIRENLAKDCDP